MANMKTIFIVDNAHATLSMLREEFEGVGYKVLTTDSGREALAILKDPAKYVTLVITRSYFKTSRLITGHNHWQFNIYLTS